MTSSRHHSRHLSWLINGSSLTTLVVAASFLVLPPNRLQAMDALKGGSAVNQQAVGTKSGQTKPAAPAASGGAQRSVDQSRAEDLRARQQKIEADNKAIDAGMKEAREKADKAMDAAVAGMAVGVAAGTTQIGAVGAAAAQGQTQQGQAGQFAAIAGLVAQRDTLSKVIGELSGKTNGDTPKQKEQLSIQLSKLNEMKAGRDQLDKQILDQLSTIRKSKGAEAQDHLEKMKEAIKNAQKELDEKAKDGNAKAVIGSLFGDDAGQTAGKHRNALTQAAGLQQAKAAEAQAAKTEIGILAAQHDEKTREITRLSAEAQKAKGSKADELKAEMNALVAQRNKLNESIGTQSAELRKIKEAEHAAAAGQLKQINSVQEAVQRELAEQQAASKKGKAADRAEAQKDMQQLKQLQDALNGSASAQKKALSQIAAEQNETAKREALHKKVAEGLRANPGKLDALIIPTESGKGGSQAGGGKGGVGSYAGLTAEALAGGKNGAKGGGSADDAVNKALNQIQDKVAAKSKEMQDKAAAKAGGDPKGKIESAIGNINQQSTPGSGKAAADQLRAAQEKKDQAASSGAKSGLSSKLEELTKNDKQKSGSDKVNANLKALQEQQQTAKSGSDQDKKSGLSSKLDERANNHKQQSGSESDKKSSSSRINVNPKVQEHQQTAKPGSDQDKKSGSSRINEALKSQQLDQSQKAASGAKAADQIKRMDEANRQKIDQIKAKQQAVATQCPNPPCNVMQQRAPSVGTSAMDRLGGGPSSGLSLAATKSGNGAKPQTGNQAKAGANGEMTQMRLQNSLQQQNKAMEMMSNIQKKQSETSGTMIRNIR